MVNAHRRSTASYVLLAAALALGASCGRSGPPGTRRPARARTALTAASCTLAAGVRTCELWARAGTLALPGGASVPVWTFSESAAGEVGFPGPALVANEGEQVEIVLHNALAAPTSLLVRGQRTPPDLEGIPPGGTRTYAFTAAAPGTFLYEAGPGEGAAHQVAMGLYGALVIRPAASPLGRAYAGDATAYDDEALLVLSEIDPALHASPDPAAFDLRGYAPTFRLINGKAFPETAPIPTAPGNRVLLRVVNAGLQHHAMAVLGAHQAVVARDGLPLAFPYRVVSETIAPGQTLDAIVASPPATVPGTRLAIHDASLLLHNAGAPGFGGMLTFLEVGSASGGGDGAGPAVTAVAVSPDRSSGAADVTVTASLSDAGTGNTGVDAAEWFLDVPGAPGTGGAMAGSFGAPEASASATIPAATVAALPSGAHLVLVRGRDALGNWGPPNFAVLAVDVAGPATLAGTVTPAVTNGSAPLALSATADDSASGGSDVVAAEWFLDAAGAPGTGAPLTVNAAAPVASVDGTVPAAALAGLAEGPHAALVRSQDALGAWGPLASIPFIVDRTGPVASGVVVSPSPNDGTMGVNASVAAVRVTAQLADALSNVAAAEGFIDAVGPAGTGFPLVARRGLFDAPSRAAWADIPLTTVAQLADGAHPVHVQGRDAAGNWGATASAPLVIDRLAPTVSGLAASPNPTNGPGGQATTFTLTAVAQDLATPVTRAEWFEGADPGPGNGTAIPVPAPAPSVDLSATVGFVALGWAQGDHAVSVRARDGAGHWSAPATLTVTVVLPNALPDAIFADGFESGTFAAWSGGVTGAPAIAAGAPLVGEYALAADLAAGPAFVTDLTPAAEASWHARLHVDPNGLRTGTAPVDVLVARDAAGASVLRVQLRMRPTAPLAYQVRVVAARAGGSSGTNFVTVPDGPHWIEVSWQSSTSAEVALYVDTLALPRDRLSPLDTSAFRVDSVRFGAVPDASGVLPGAPSGTLILDAFASTRSTLIGGAP